MAAVNDVTTYWVDNEDRIIRVCDNWNRFALDNGGERVEASNVVGRSLWEFISGDATKMWLGAMLSLCRLRGEPIERPYRCDTPTMRRFMNMKVVPEGKGVLRVEHEICSVEERWDKVYFRTPRNVTLNLCMRCSVCGRIQEDEKWIEPTLCRRLTEGRSRLDVAYAVCEDCTMLLPYGVDRPPSRERREPLDDQ